jgi:anti-sigma regulatory factor (Ser/Thr protein kinase)
VKPGALQKHTARSGPLSATVMTAATGTAIRACLTIPGQPEHIHAARQLVEAALGPDSPCTWTAVLLTSELVANSMLHSNSALPGQTITISVTCISGDVRVEVCDAGGTSVPSPKVQDNLADHGRGLQLVRDLSARWGYRREPKGLATWFEVTAESPVAAPGRQ